MTKKMYKVFCFWSFSPSHSVWWAKRTDYDFTVTELRDIHWLYCVVESGKFLKPQGDEEENLRINQVAVKYNSLSFVLGRRENKRNSEEKQKNSIRRMKNKSWWWSEKSGFGFGLERHLNSNITSHHPCFDAREINFRRAI